MISVKVPARSVMGLRRQYKKVVDGIKSYECVFGFNTLCVEVPYKRPASSVFHPRIILSTKQRRDHDVAKKRLLIAGPFSANSFRRTKRRLRRHKAGSSSSRRCFLRCRVLNRICDVNCTFQGTSSYQAGSGQTEARDQSPSAL